MIAKEFAICDIGGISREIYNNKKITLFLGHFVSKNQDIWFFVIFGPIFHKNIFDIVRFKFFYLSFIQVIDTIL